MRFGMGFFVKVEPVFFGERHAEFALDCVFGVPNETFAKVAVLAGPLRERIG